MSSSVENAFLNPDHSNQTTEAYLKKKQNKDSLLLLRFNDNAVQTEEVQAHLVFH